MSLRRRSFLVFSGVALVVASAATLRRSSSSSPSPEARQEHATKAAFVGPGERDKLARIRLRGSVRDAEGAPIAAALVTITSRQAGLFDARLQEGPGLRWTRSDHRGEWSFDDVVAEHVIVGANLAGYAPTSLDLRADAMATRLDIVMREGGVTLSGHVRDNEGHSLGGALVVATAQADSWSAKPGAPPLVAVSNTEGSYAMSITPANYQVAGRYAGYAAHPQKLQSEVATRLDLTLHLGATIEGIVIDTDGRPVAGVWVNYSDGQNEPILGHGGTWSDETGQFSLVGVTEGLVEIYAAGRSHVAAGLELRLGVGEVRSDVRVYVERAFSITGKVVDKSDGRRGVTGAIVVLGGPDQYSFETTMRFGPTDDSGAFQILGVAPGNYVIKVEGDIEPTVESTSVSVADASVHELRIAVRAGVSIRGMVRPPSAAMFTLNFERLNGTLHRRFDTTAQANADGQFVIHNVPVGKHDLVAKSGAHAGTLTVKVGADNDVNALVVDMKKLATFSGKVVTGNGKPMPHIGVVLRGVSPPEPTLEQMNNDPDLAYTMFMVAAPTGGAGESDADGSFVVTGLSGGDYYMYVRDRRGPLHHLESETVHVASSGHLGGQIIRVAPQRARTVSGVVFDNQGKPAPDTWVTVGPRTYGCGTDSEPPYNADWASHREKSAVLTDDDGRFSVDDVPSTTIYIAARRPSDGAEATIEATQATEVTLHLTAKETSEVRVVQQGRPVAAYWLSLSNRGGWRRVLDAEGRSRLRAPWVRVVRVVSEDGSGCVLREPSLGRQEITVELTRRGHVRGRLLNAVTKRPIVGAKVTAGATRIDRARIGKPFARTADDGRFELRDIADFQCGNDDVGGLSTVRFESEAGVDLAEKLFSMRAAGTVNLGDVYAILPGAPASDSSKGTLGFAFGVATWKERPNPSPEDELPSYRTAASEFLWVTHVEPESAAYRIGLRVGDRISGLGTRSATGSVYGSFSTSDFDELVRGQPYSISIVRRNKWHKFYLVAA